ncbi:MAG: hypothetical protein Q4A72_05550 [Bacillota bacterium]|nr:hypothetical protein [Bacillota bacterium]
MGKINISSGGSNPICSKNRTKINGATSGEIDRGGYSYLHVIGGHSTGAIVGGTYGSRDYISNVSVTGSLSHLFPSPVPNSHNMILTSCYKNGNYYFIDYTGFIHKVSSSGSVISKRNISTRTNVQVMESFFSDHYCYSVLNQGNHSYVYKTTLDGDRLIREKYLSSNRVNSRASTFIVDNNTEVVLVRSGDVYYSYDFHTDTIRTLDKINQSYHLDFPLLFNGSFGMSDFFKKRNSEGLVYKIDLLEAFRANEKFYYAPAQLNFYSSESSDSRFLVGIFIDRFDKENVDVRFFGETVGKHSYFWGFHVTDSNMLVRVNSSGRIRFNSF